MLESGVQQKNEMKDRYKSIDNAEFWTVDELYEELFRCQRNLDDIESGLNNPKQLKEWIRSLEKMISEKKKQS